MNIHIKPSVLALSVFLVACGGSSSDHSIEESGPQYDISDKNNYVTAYKFQDRYNTLVEDCGASDQPAYLCSGLIVRGVRAAAQPKPWKHRDKDKQKGAISIAYIRHDQNFKLPTSTYHAGVLLHPEFENVAALRCASPMDLNTDLRIGSKNGCLASTEQKFSDQDYTVKDCQDWGIDSADKWLEIFLPIMQTTQQKGHLDQFTGQTCSFSMGKEDQQKFATRAQAFNLFADIRKGVPHNLRPEWWNNELFINIWDDKDSNTAPLEAFYYNFADAAGLKEAQDFQRKYYQDTQKFLPILAIEFTVDEAANIYYSAHDQIVFESEKLSNVEKMKLSIQSLIAAPPTPDSVLFAQDQQSYQNAQQATVARWNLAKEDANISTAYLLQRFTAAESTMLKQQAVIDLVNYTTSFEQSAVADIKAQYKRIRPFVYHQSTSCTPQDETMLKNNGSYPSGHTVRGYLVAEALTQIQPSKSVNYENVALDYAASRVVCNVHWQSDTVAGKYTAAIIMNTLKYDPEYIRLSKAAQRTTSL